MKTRNLSAFVPWDNARMVVDRKLAAYATHGVCDGQ